MTNVRKNLVATISPQVAEPLTLRLQQRRTAIDTTSTGVLATLIGEGGSGGYSYALVSGALPTHTSLQPDGSILVTGALIQETATFLAEVQDSSSTVFDHSFSIKINSRLSTYPGDPYCVVGETFAPYQYTYRIVGATGAVTYAVVSGSLPTGLSLSSAGEVTGTPTDNTPPYVVADFIVEATDAGSGEVLQIPSTIIIYAQRTLPTGNFVPNGYLLSGYNGGLGDIPAIIKGEPWEATWVWNQYGPGAIKPVNYPAVTPVKFKDVLPGIPGSLTTFLTAADTAALSTGLNTLRIGFFDAFGQFTAGLTIFVQVAAAVKAQQLALLPKKAGVTVGTEGAFNIDFAGTGVASVTNTGGTITVTINAGAGGVTTVNAFTGAITLAATSPISIASGAGTVTYSHANSGVTAGEYTQSTVNATGHVTAAQQMFGTAQSQALAAGVRWVGTSFTQSLTRVIRFTGAAGGTSFLSGLPNPTGAGGWSMYLVVNGSTTILTVENEQAIETTAANRFAIGANFNLAAGQGATFWYDNTTRRWRCVGRQS